MAHRCMPVSLVALRNLEALPEYSKARANLLQNLKLRRAWAQSACHLLHHPTASTDDAFRSRKLLLLSFYAIARVHGTLIACANALHALSTHGLGPPQPDLFPPSCPSSLLL